jgi:protein ImuB
MRIRSDEDSTGQLFACLRSARLPAALLEIAGDFSPRIQRYGTGCVVFDVAGLGRLLGNPDAIGAELARAVEKHGDPQDVDPDGGTVDDLRPRPRLTSRYGIRIEPHPAEHAALSMHPAVTAVDRSPVSAIEPRPVEAAKIRIRPRSPVVRIAIAPTQVSALLLSFAGPSWAAVVDDEEGALAPLPIRVLPQLMAAIHDATVLRVKAKPPAAAPDAPGWPSWSSCEQAFDILERWGVKTLGELAALPAPALSARLGKTGVALQQLARGIDPHPLVPDPDVPRFIERMELEWPIDGLEPLSFVLARLLEPLSVALERADRAAAAIRLDLRLVDRSMHGRMLQLPAAIRDAKVLRTLLLLDLESHPPSAAIDIVTVEIDPAPGRVIQYSLLERAMPSTETLATLTARLGALVGESRCGSPVLLDSYRPDAFELQRFAPVEHATRPARAGTGAPGRAAERDGTRVSPCLRRFRPPVAVRVTVERGRPAHVAIDRRGMPGGRVTQAAGPWRSSGEWWNGATRQWDRDEWDVSLGDGASCRLFLERETGRWFMEGVLD